MKLQKVTGSRPERSYVLGSEVATLPLKLIVEATQKMSKKYSWVLGKGESKQAKLCKQYP